MRRITTKLLKQTRFVSKNVSKINMAERAENFQVLIVSFAFGLAGSFAYRYFNEKSENKESETIDISKIEDEQKEKIRKQFEQYVDLIEDGEKSMSLEAFIKSITHEKVTLKESQVPEDLKVMFVMADLNGNGVLSFSEYSFFLTLLSSSNERFKLAFEMMDKDGSGKIDLNEFMQIMNTEGVDSKFVNSMKQLPLMHKFFGEDCSGELSFSEFSSFVHTLKRSILQYEFKFHSNGSKTLTYNQFFDIVNNSLFYNQTLSPELKKQLQLLKKKKSIKYIDFETFEDFHSMSQNFSAIKKAVELYDSIGIDLNRKAFKNAVEKVSGLKVNERVVDLVFALFDEDNNGVLELEEFKQSLN
eukprot:gene3863-7023_t